MKVGMKLKGRSLLNLDSISNDDMLGLIGLAINLKKQKRCGRRGNLLRRKNIALIFEKSSTRTRCATVVAAADEGGRTEYLAADEIHLGKKESVVDTAKVLGRMFDAIMFRGFKQETVELLARHSRIPVWNGLTDDFHPTQVLADLMTVKEHFGKLKGLRMVYLGDGRNNVANSLMMGCAKAGLHFVNGTPKILSPRADLVRNARVVAAGTGATITIENDPCKAVRGANVVCTDVWASMGEEAKLKERIRLLRPYQVNMKLMQATGNLKAGKVIFLHCLPAFHDNKTVVTSSIGAMEVTDDVFQAPFSLVFDEAENRVHTIKALMVATLS